MSESRTYGMQKGAVYPASAARGLLNPMRRLINPPGRLARFAALQPGQRVLELGCGPGWFSPSLAARVGEASLHLADLQAQMLLHALQRVPGARPTAVDAGALPFADASFDVVIAAVMLGEVPDPGAAVRQVARVLRAGGRLVVFETRTDPDFIAYPKMRDMAFAAGLRPAARRGRLSGYTAAFMRP